VTKQLFLAFGIPKSGTTFLQRMLDMHPEVSCPSEQAFASLASDVGVVLDRYRKTLVTVDGRTGGQGVPAFDTALRDNVLAAVITTLAESFAGAKPVAGLNDNSVIDRLALFDAILGRPRMIAIFRDPVDTAVSTWRHNRRMTDREPERAAAHLKRLYSPDGTFDGYVRLFAEQYRTKAIAYLDYAEGRPNFVTTRYESLVSDTRDELRRLFGFLGCDSSPRTIAPIVAGSSRAAMAKTASDPEFFGICRTPADRPAVTDQTRRWVRDRLAPEYRRLGYPDPA